MTHDELLAMFDDYEKHFDQVQDEPKVFAMLRAVIEACKSWENQRVIPISYVLGAIEKELNG